MLRGTARWSFFKSFKLPRIKHSSFPRLYSRNVSFSHSNGADSSASQNVDAKTQPSSNNEQKQNNNTNKNKKNIFQDPTFYTALGMVGGVISYSYNEHLRRKQSLINTAKGILVDLKQSYDTASKATFAMELKISETSKKHHPPGFTSEERLDFARFAELQYRIILASDTRMTSPQLRLAVEDNFNLFLKLIFSPDFETNPLITRDCIGHYFLLHQLIIGYEKSLSEFITNITKSYIFDKKSFDTLYDQQKKIIEKADDVAKSQIFNKDPMEVYLNLTKIFRQNHFDERKPEETVGQVRTPRLR